MKPTDPMFAAMGYPGLSKREIASLVILHGLIIAKSSDESQVRFKTPTGSELSVDFPVAAVMIADDWIAAVNK